jgi:hypothetical protein
MLYIKNKNKNKSDTRHRTPEYLGVGAEPTRLGQVQRSKIELSGLSEKRVLSIYRRKKKVRAAMLDIIPGTETS